jgi:hypothetical protein
MGISNGSIKRAKKVLMDKDEKTQVKAAEVSQKSTEKKEDSFTILRKQSNDKELEDYLL